VSLRRLAFALPLLSLLTIPAYAAEDEAALKGQAAAIVKEYGGTLLGALKQSLDQSGPVAAISVCNDRGPGIAAEMAAKSGWKVGRTSLKPRNSSSAPTDYETAVMREFETRLAAGEPIDTLVRAEAVTEGGAKVYHFIKAIPTAALCLNCHGEALTPEVKQRLAVLYPSDTATGFKVGDMRGIFTLSRPM
jgi:hypothetical protein